MFGSRPSSAQEMGRHYRTISLLRTRWLHFWWLELPGEMQGQHYCAALRRLQFADRSTKTCLQVLPMQTIFPRRTVLSRVTWSLSYVCRVKYSATDATHRSSQLPTCKPLLHKNVCNNNTKRTENIRFMHASAPDLRVRR